MGMGRFKDWVPGSLNSPQMSSHLCAASEWLMDNHRAHAICLQFCFFSLGNLYLLGFAYNFLHWRLLILVGGAPSFFLIFYIW